MLLKINLNFSCQSGLPWKLFTCWIGLVEFDGEKKRDLCMIFIDLEKASDRILVNNHVVHKKKQVSSSYFGSIRICNRIIERGLMFLVY